jgi:hypothetical protein
VEVALRVKGPIRIIAKVSFLAIWREQSSSDSRQSLLPNLDMRPRSHFNSSDA